MLLFMAKRKNTEGLAIIAQLAEQLGVDLEDAHHAVATNQHDAVARYSDGSLEVRLTSFVSRPIVTIESPRSPGIYIELVDHQRDLAPEGAIYRIKAYMPDSNRKTGGTELCGEIYCIYVGKEGIILDDISRRDLLKKNRTI